MSNLPLGAWILEKLGCCTVNDRTRRTFVFKWLVFILTFVTYTAYHASRKPISVVKNVLNQNCTGRVPPHDVDPYSNPHWCDWQPFDGEDSNALLGYVDSAYLFSYAFFMFFSGMLAERMNLRFFLALGMLLSAFFTWALGGAYSWGIHSLAYFICIQIVIGIFQASGWPGVVTVMGNWNGRSKRGLIFGIWNCHTSLGNILGSLMAGWFVDTDWGLSFIVPGAFIALSGVLNFLFLTPYPEEIGCNAPVSEPGLLSQSVESSDGTVPSPDSGRRGSGPRTHRDRHNTGYGSFGTAADRPAARGFGRTSERTRLLAEHTEETAPGDDDVTTVGSTNQLTTDSSEVEASKAADEDKAIGFFQAFLIPGVLPFAICLFFSKLVSYTFLYWLPRYLHSAANYSATESANLSTLFDVGGAVGGILAGFLNDWTGAPGIVCVLLLLVAIPLMFVYQSVATVSHGLNTFMLLVVGLMVNGPYALITTAVSADLGTSLRDNAKALATVTAIIDGTGSVGAGLGPLLAGWVSAGDNWTNVFIILMCSDAIAILSLAWVVKHEASALLERRRLRRQQQQAALA